MGNVCFANMYGWYHKMKKVRPFVLFVNHMCKSQRKTGKPLLQRGALLYAMYGEGELGADCYCAASDYEQAQNAAEPIAQAIENSEPLARHTQIYKGVNGTVSGAMYRYNINGIAYQNKFKVLTKTQRVLKERTLILC